MSVLKLRYRVCTSEVLCGITSDMAANIFCSCQYVSSRIGSFCVSGSLGFSKRWKYSHLLRYCVVPLRKFE